MKSSPLLASGSSRVKKRPSGCGSRPLSTRRVRVVETQRHVVVASIGCKGSSRTRRSTVERRVLNAAGEISVDLRTDEKTVQLKRLGPYLMKRNVTHVESRVKKRSATLKSRRYE
eukprot:TRINITY_DN51421_c0_g1_i1.p1 TRINITY_DN51421_c0_g1~~TRINITY_DN51421_c0_g1_i1.p1  ORF type:complete len:115 (+),score=22.59 TRINITY_DN51421_c0_g1_i1:153-497(+)